MYNQILLIRLNDGLTVAERQLVVTLPATKGPALLKEVRTQLMEAARPRLEAIIQDITSTKVVSMYHDISTVTGEEIVAFTLSDVPAFHEVKGK